MQSFQQAIEAIDFYSPAEERFNRRRRTVGLCAAPLVFVLLLAWPTPSLSLQAHRLLPVLVAVAVLWITEALPVAITAIIGPAFAILLGVASAQQTLAPFADPIIFLFIGSCILAEAMFVHGLDRRLVFTALGSPFVGTSARRLLVVYGALTTAVSMWVSNTATTAMMFPIGMALVAPVAQTARPGDSGARRFAVAMMLVTSIAATVGGLATPVGAPPNLIGFGMLQRLAGVRISFLGWMGFGVPIVIVLFALVAWASSLGLRDFKLPAAAVDQIRTEREALGPLSVGQRNVAIAFGVTVALWLIPGVLNLVGAETLGARYTSLMPEGVAAILGASLLFVLPTDWRTRRFTLTWEEAVRIDWGIVLLYGGGMALGELAFSTGLATAIGQPLVHGAGPRAPVLLVAVFTAAGILLSQVTSNTAAAAILVPVAIAACGTAGVPPLVTALGATFGSSLGIVLPISSASNAIVYSSGHVPIRAMTRAGILLDVFAFAVILAVLVALA